MTNVSHRCTESKNELDSFQGSWDDKGVRLTFDNTPILTVL